MNIIKIHGFLSTIFGKEIKIRLGKVDTFAIVNALDSIKTGFRKLLPLSKEEGQQVSALQSLNLVAQAEQKL